jgi:putative DNA primase/helicase
MLSGARNDHWLLFWIGTGRNGKNTLGELFEWILGDYAKTIPTETLMASKNERHLTELANLRGLRAAISSEVPEGAHWNEARIKQVTGDARLSARYMRQDLFEFPRTHKHLIYGNHRPQLRVVDEAIRARFHVVPFRAQFTDELGNRDPHLPEKLRAEAPAILAWLIDGHLHWLEDGRLKKCEAVRRETEDYLNSQSTVDLWIAERCELLQNDDRPTGTLDKGSTLYTDFKGWKEARGEQPMSQTRWGEWMGERFGKVMSNGTRYRGIRLR